MMEYVLETRSLVKRYRRFAALDGLDMHVPKGAIYGFVGRNGAGKTTLIRIVTGLQRPTSGGYTLYGIEHDDKAVAAARRRMGAVVETPSIYLDLSAEDNLRTQYTILGLPSDDGIAELLAFVGLEGTGGKKAGRFSLGMKQRLGIAVALAGRPDFLILDEPVNGLDPQGIVEIRELILKLNREMGVTVLVSSHILDELARIATHYGFIDGGRIIREISAAELERSCARRTVVTVSHIDAFTRSLDRLGLAYRVTGGDTAEIYGSVGVSALADAAKDEGCALLSFDQREESLESFYLNAIGGEHRA